MGYMDIGDNYQIRGCSRGHKLVKCNLVEGQK